MFGNFKSAKGSDEFYDLQKLCFVMLSHIHPMVSCMEYEGGINFQLRRADHQNIIDYQKLHHRIVEICLYDRPSTVGEVKLLHQRLLNLFVKKGIVPLGNSIVSYLSYRHMDPIFKKLYEKSYDGKDLEDWLSLLPQNLEPEDAFFIDYEKLLMLLQKWQVRR